ncbi:MAG TPA: cupin domain-containing protein [Blastocatellia bacterium]|nr:cupin domain-containing protein [Blastocatellia bacterium]
MKRRMVWLLTTSLALLVLQFQIAAQSKSGKPREAIIVPPEAGTRIGRGNWKLTKDQSGGSLAVSEVYNANASTDWGPGHVHTREDEIWYVIEGELSFKVGGRTATAGPGTLVFAPRGVPHQYIVSKAPARYLLIFTPAGIEPLFPEVDDLRNKVRQGSPEYYEKLEEMRAQYGVYAAKKWEGITSTEDPTDGTWDLDVRASKFEPGPAWKNQTRIYKADGKSIKMIATGVNGQGKRVRFEFDAAYDGKDYPVTGNPKVETISQVRVDYYTVKTTTKRDGLVTATSTRVISKDGKVMNISTSGTDEKGVPFNNTLVLRKR